MTMAYPESIEQVSLDDLQAAYTRQMRAAFPGWSQSPDDPLTQDLRVQAERERLLRMLVNRRILRNLAPWATGGDLDLIGQLFATPRRAGEMDDTYRARVQTAYAVATPIGSDAWYRGNALAVDARIFDVGIIVDPTTKAIAVYLLSRENDGGTAGQPSAALNAQVQAALNAPDKKHITDVITVSAPTIAAFTANLTLTKAGSDAIPRGAVAQAVDDYNGGYFRLGQPHYQSRITAWLINRIPEIAAVQWDAGSTADQGSVAESHAWHLTQGAVDYA